MPTELPTTGAVAPLSGTWRLAERPLLDRETERHAIDDMLDLVRQGFSGALVLAGDHGVGKTALVDYAIRAGAAVDFGISTVVGAEPEVDFAFGAVHQLLIPFLPLIDALPVPQRQAVTVALGMETGPPPDPFLVGLACLTLMSRAAEAHPVLCAIDDANWIDAESALVLAFVARRLYADRVGMIVALKEDGESAKFEGLPTIQVGGLPNDAAADLLQSVAAARLDPQLVDRILADTSRNALALVEIGSNFTREELANRVYRPEPMPVGRRLQLRYLQRVARLSADARQLVLLVAADGSGDRGLVRQAAAEANIDADAAEAAAEAANLLEVSGNSVHFRHPLIRAAVYNGASDADRRRAHRLLAEVSDCGGDPDRPVWHRAAAAAEPDEGVAADLEGAAERAGARGAWSTAASLLRRSIDLTPDDARRARCEIGLAEAELVIGQPENAQEAADGALPRLPDAATRGRAQRISREALFAEGRDDEAAEVLADASEALADDPAAATGALLTAVDAANWAGARETERIGRVAIPPPRPGASKPPISQLLLAGYHARFIGGYEDSVAPLHAALQRLRTEDPDPERACDGSG